MGWPNEKVGRLTRSTGLMTVSLTFESYGSPEHPAVVLIHPFPFRAEFWSAVGPAISNAGYFVVAPNLRGCATSPSDDAEPDMNLLAADVWQLLSQQGIERATILGISLGGYVALAMLRAKPNSVTGIGLIDTKVTADSPAAVRNRQRIASEIQDSLSLSEYAEQMLPTLLSTFTHEHRTEVIDQVRTWISASSAPTVAWLQQAMAGRADSSSALKSFAGPTLLIRGSDDVVSKPEDFQTMLDLAQNPTFIQIVDCGHLPPVEDPQATGDAIVDWLINS